MKRLITLLVSALALLAPALPMSASDSSTVKGEMTLGVAGGLATYNHSGFASLFFQYTFVPHVRIAPEVGYIFRGHDTTGFEISCDMHFPFRIYRGIYVYPLAGLTFNSWNYLDDGSALRMGGDLGGGFDFYMTRNLKINVQGKYSLMKDTSGAFISIGFGYVF